jgi:SAM-dependent methyltransferase
MPASSSASPEQIKDSNIRYHDAAAESYDSKWGIDFGPIGRDQIRGKLVKALGVDSPEPLGSALEIGAGTGYFSLNLAAEGLVGPLTATDISPGMLRSLERTAAELGVEVETVVAEAEELPFEDDSFDLVLGHAILHHIPDLDRAFAEFERVLRPGGLIIFCGEPSRYGDRIAAVPKRVGTLLGPAWRLAVRARRPDDHAGDAGPDKEVEDELESEVDVHAFGPADLRDLATRAGFEQVRISGEELVANMWGWGLRSLEATAEPDSVSAGWRNFAFRSYIALQRLDTSLLEPRLPAELFYNLLLSARKPS